MRILQAGNISLEVLNIQSDELRAPEGSGEAEKQQGAVAKVLQPIA
jgi:hypothetical protein